MCRTPNGADYTLQASRIQRISVLKSGGLPYISRPIVKIRAAHHSATTTPAAPIMTVSQPCESGGGALEVMRSSIANVLTGGMKLITVLNVEFGWRAIGSA